jgi:hypothetical protein
MMFHKSSIFTATSAAIVSACLLIGVGSATAQEKTNYVGPSIGINKSGDILYGLNAKFKVADTMVLVRPMISVFLNLTSSLIPELVISVLISLVVVVLEVLLRQVLTAEYTLNLDLTTTSAILSHSTLITNIEMVVDILASAAHTDSNLPN